MPKRIVTFSMLMLSCMIPGIANTLDFDTGTRIVPLRCVSVDVLKEKMSSLELAVVYRRMIDMSTTLGTSVSNPTIDDENAALQATCRRIDLMARYGAFVFKRIDRTEKSKKETEESLISAFKRIAPDVAVQPGIAMQLATEMVNRRSVISVVDMPKITWMLSKKGISKEDKQMLLDRKALLDSESSNDKVAYNAYMRLLYSFGLSSDEITAQQNRIQSSWETVDRIR